MDDEAPVQSGVTIGFDEVPPDGWNEIRRELFSSLRPCQKDPDPIQNLSPAARDVISRILSSPGTGEGKGMTATHVYPSNNEVLYCVFSLGGGQTLPCRRDELTGALEELVQAGFLMELDTRYKLIERQE